MSYNPLNRIADSKVLNPEQLRHDPGLLETESRVVLCHGVFDILHLGHLEYLAEAKSMGEVLVVSVTSDRFVKKGPGRPVLPAEHRAAVLAATEVVDYVLISDAPTAEDIIRIVKPSLYVKGPDYLDEDSTGRLQLERAAVQSVGGDLVHTRGTKYSSTRFLEDSLFAIQDSVQLAKLENFVGNSFDFSQVSSVLDGLSSLNVMVVGEVIVDCYQSCRALGKSSKEPLLAYSLGRESSYLGGAYWIARQLAELGSIVTLVSLADIGDESTSMRMASEANSTLSLRLIETSEWKTVVKRRFVESDYGRRVFETYQFSESEPDVAAQKRLRGEIEVLADEVDLIIIADYGHGLLGEPVIELLDSVPAMVGLNVQSNAGNQGKNSVFRYSNIDYVVLNGSEIANEIRHRKMTPSEMAAELSGALGVKALAVTEGEYGLVIAREETEPLEVPAFTANSKDRVGAGDALFLTIASLWSLGVEDRLAGLIGNAMGAIATQTIGTSHIITKEELLRALSTVVRSGPSDSVTDRISDTP